VRPRSAVADERALERLGRHAYGELVVDLAEEASFLVRPMFGCLACYVHGRLVLVLADRRPPWRGLLVPTDRRHHAALRRALPALRPHPVLGKWLFLSAGAAHFEAEGRRLAGLARAGDPRLGVEPESGLRPSPRRGRARRPRRA
jgi:hypothetical protein